MKKPIFWGATLIIALLLVWQTFGGYNVAATEPHWTVTNALLEFVRERSIHTRADDIEVPELNDETLILAGAANYDAMCTACHLAPGIEDSELHTGLYPQPPKLFSPEHEEHDAAATFWVIKNGIKLTGMPAWGPTHDDEAIWSMVAFLQKLPELDAASYQHLVEKAKASGHGHGGANHSHGAGDEDLDNGGHSHDGAAGHHDATESPAHSHNEPAKSANHHDDGHSHDHGNGMTQKITEDISPLQAVVLHRMEAYVAAVNRMDIAAMEDFILDNEDFVVVEGTHENRGWANYRDTHLAPEFKVLKDFSYKLIDSSVQVKGQMAVVAFTYQIKARIKDRKLEKTSKGTAIWRLVDGEWKLQYIHTS